MRTRLNISKRLYDLRKEHGLTQAQVAKVLYIDRSCYCYYETGRSQMQMDKIIALTHFYEISVDELLGLELRTKK